MTFGSLIVNNPKFENEKSAQKRQFCDFALKNVHHFWAGKCNSNTNNN